MPGLQILDDDLEGLASLVAFAKPVHGGENPLLFFEAPGGDQGVEIDAEIADEFTRRLDPLCIRGNRLGAFPRRILLAFPLAGAGPVALGEPRQRAAQALDHAVVVDDQAVLLAAAHAIYARNRLHQRVALHRLVEIKRRQALHVEAGQPHRADDGDAEGVVGLLELVLQIALHHLLAVRRDVERLVAEVAPLGELGHLALLLRCDHAAFGRLHPFHLLPALLEQRRWFLTLRREERLFGGDGGFQLRGLLLPLGDDQVVHLHAGDLVEADHQRLAAATHFLCIDDTPALVKMLDEVLRHLLQPRR